MDGGWGDGSLCKVLDNGHKNLNLIFRTHINQLDLVAHTLISAQGRQNRRILGALQPVSLATSSKISERPCLCEQTVAPVEVGQRVIQTHSGKGGGGCTANDHNTHSLFNLCLHLDRHIDTIFVFSDQQLDAWTATTRVAVGEVGEPSLVLHS